jgi:hypothetical protein
MALSTLNPSLPALEDLITLTLPRPPPKRIGPRFTRDIRRDILLLREHNTRTKQNIRTSVKETWEAVGADELLALVREMPARCEAVIAAQGGYTK